MCCNNIQGQVVVSPKSTLQHVRQQILDDFDDDMLPPSPSSSAQRRDFVFVVNGDTIDCEQEQRVLAWDVINKNIRIIPTKKSSLHSSKSQYRPQQQQRTSSSSSRAINGTQHQPEPKRSPRSQNEIVDLTIDDEEGKERLQQTPSSMISNGRKKKRRNNNSKRLPEAARRRKPKPLSLHMLRTTAHKRNSPEPIHRPKKEEEEKQDTTTTTTLKKQQEAQPQPQHVEKRKCNIFPPAKTTATEAERAHQRENRSSKGDDDNSSASDDSIMDYFEQQHLKRRKSSTRAVASSSFCSDAHSTQQKHDQQNICVRKKKPSDQINTTSNERQISANPNPKGDDETRNSRGEEKTKKWTISNDASFLAATEKRQNTANKNKTTSLVESWTPVAMALPPPPNKNERRHDSAENPNARQRKSTNSSSSATVSAQPLVKKEKTDALSKSRELKSGKAKEETTGHSETKGNGPFKQESAVAADTIRSTATESKSLTTAVAVITDVSSKGKHENKNKAGLDLVWNSPALPEWEGPPNDRLDLKGGWPRGWVKRRFRRLNGKTAGQTDNYWYTPKKGYKLRSMVEVRKFMLALMLHKDDKDDETLAYKNFKNSEALLKVATQTTTTNSNTTDPVNTKSLHSEIPTVFPSTRSSERHKTHPTPAGFVGAFYQPQQQFHNHQNNYYGAYSPPPHHSCPQQYGRLSPVMQQQFQAPSHAGYQNNYFNAYLPPPPPPPPHSYPQQYGRLSPATQPQFQAPSHLGPYQNNAYSHAPPLNDNSEVLGNEQQDSTAWWWGMFGAHMSD